jgi:hypothetical protein
MKNPEFRSQISESKGFALPLRPNSGFRILNSDFWLLSSALY